MQKLNNKFAIITGGTGALGRAVVKKFLEEGSKVIITYIVESEYEECKKILNKYESNINYFKTDITNEEDFNKVVNVTKNSLGKIDFLINVAGGFLYKKFIDYEVDEYNEMMDMNLKSCFICSKAVLPTFIENNYGKIVNVAARSGLHGSTGMAAYSAAKAGVMRLTETVAEEVRDYDINVNAIIPGTIDTPRNREDMPDRDFSKWVKPKELAEVILFLVSDGSKIINGATIPALGKT